MNKSESIASLAKALAQAQPLVEGALKDKVNPAFRSKYADLGAVMDAIKPAIAAHGLSFVQVSHDIEHGAKVETVILHESGEWISCGAVSVPAGKHDAHGFGSALTYARRYSLSAAFGVAPEDDDGNAATKTAPKAITPVKSSLKGVERNEEDMAFLRGLAAELVQLVEAENNVTAAFEHLEAQKLDNDQKLQLWDVLQPNSKTRNKITEVSRARKAVVQGMAA